MKKHVNIAISGKVVNVGFRFGAMERAYKDGVTGFVKYAKNKMVWIEVEGEEDQLDSFIKWCRKGCLGSIVNEVSLDESLDLKGFSSFEMK